jgi:hypothetical protein
MNYGVNELIVEYPKFSDILAQFLSIFNVLMILGIIGQLWSDR